MLKRREKAEFKRTFFLPFVVNFVSGILSEVELSPTMTKQVTEPCSGLPEKEKKREGEGGRNKSSEMIFRVYCFTNVDVLAE